MRLPWGRFASIAGGCSAPCNGALNMCAWRWLHAARLPARAGLNTIAHAAGCEGCERRALLPLSCMPERSSRFTCSSTPAGRPGTRHGWMGVGVIAMLTLCLGTWTDGCTLAAWCVCGACCAGAVCRSSKGGDNRQGDAAAGSMPTLPKLQRWQQPKQTSRHTSDDGLIWRVCESPGH
jgi:hypothetical protein